MPINGSRFVLEVALKRLLSIVLLLGVFASAVAVAQQQSAQPEPIQDTLFIDVDLVNVLFTVTERRGRFVRHLSRDDFKVYEDGELQTISNFSSDSDLPLTVAFLIDISGSVRDRLRFQQEAAIEFFYSTLIRGKDRGLVISFDSGVDLIQDYTDDPEELARAIRTLRAGGATALYDAIHLASTEKLAGQSGRRIVIVISDGDDNSSRLSLTETVEATQRNDVVVYAISTNTTAFGGGRNSRGDNVLNRLADETGGRVFSPRRIQDLASNFQDITDELRFQYTLAYRPINTERDGSFRRIRIDPTDDRYIVRARTGYYALR